MTTLRKLAAFLAALLAALGAGYGIGTHFDLSGRAETPTPRPSGESGTQHMHQGASPR